MTRKIEIPQKITKNLFISVGIGKYNFGRIEVSDSDYKSSDPEFARSILTEFEMEIDIPETNLDFKKEMVAVLEKKKSNINAMYHLKLKEVQDQIDDLLAIEHQGGNYGTS